MRRRLKLASLYQEPVEYLAGRVELEDWPDSRPSTAATSLLELKAMKAKQFYEIRIEVSK